MKLKNKVALITGASSGIGKETAKLFSKEGAKIILTARDSDKLKQVEEGIKDAESFSMDITDKKEVDDVVKKIIHKYGKVDVLVNSAGIARWGPIQDITHEDFEEQVKINLIGSFNCIKAVVSSMIANKSGSIVNVITSTVKNTKANRVAYAASKYGQAGLSNAVHEDLKEKGISVVAVYPGKTDTPIHDPYLDKNDTSRESMLKVSDVAEKILEAALLKVEDDVKEISINPR
ncbi:SDR family oxidoreductase [Candidatus Woesearchaeota archaeon]|nr:SDR family oxidoreductase [Candidatus Woesearchaeota archaeon]